MKERFRTTMIYRFSIIEISFYLLLLITYVIFNTNNQLTCLSDKTVYVIECLLLSVSMCKKKCFQINCLIIYLFINLYSITPLLK